MRDPIASPKQRDGKGKRAMSIDGLLERSQGREGWFNGSVPTARTAKAVFLFFMVLAALAGCWTEPANPTSSRQNQELTKQPENPSNQDLHLKHLIDELTRLRNYQYEVLSAKIDRPPYDGVVYVANVPENLDEQEVYLIRSTIEFAGSDYGKVSLWMDRETALPYVDGAFDPGEGVLGWKGYDQRFGLIDNTGAPPRLRQYYSRDDSVLIDFGKYKAE